MPLVIHPALRHVILKPKRALTFRTSANDTTAQTTYTFASLSIGAPTHDRIVIICAVSNEAASTAGDLLSSATITPTGSSAIPVIIHASVAGTSNNEASVAICSAVVPVGTTISVATTYPDAQARAGVAVYTLTGYNFPWPLSTNTAQVDATTDVSVSLTVLSNQVGIVASTNRSGGSPTCTWTNATEDVDFLLESGNAGASTATVASGAGTVTVTAGWSESGSLGLAGAVWS